MSTSEVVGEFCSSADNEQINLFEDYVPFFVPEYYSGKQTSSSVESIIYPKWRKTSRTPADFSISKTSLSSCDDSDYAKWLENYYEKLPKKGSLQPSFDKQNDTCDLIKEKPKKVFHSLFPPIKKDAWYESTKYWGPEAVRRHWPVRCKKKEYLFVPSIHPNLDLRSRYGRYHSQLNSTEAIPERNYRKVVCNYFDKTIRDLAMINPKLMKLIYCDNFCNLKWFDYLTKSSILRNMCKFFRTQYLLEKVFLENANLDRLQGIIILCALSRNGGDVIKELHIWKMFAYGQSPLLTNELFHRGRIDRKEYFTKIHYLQILHNFSTLTHLSVNYAYLANETGDALLHLKSIRTSCLRELRILCLKNERPCLANPGQGIGGWAIADGVWRRAAEWCPEMRVKFVFLDMPQYENIIVFLSKSIPVSYVYISSGIDFNFENPWDIDSTLLELRNWYSTTLDTLNLHLWHHRDLLDFVIKNKILEEFPNLENFEFIGVLEDIETLEDFCCQLSKGTYKLKRLLFWVEEQYTNRKKTALTVKRIAEIKEKYHRRFQVIDVDADIGTYAM